MSISSKAFPSITTYVVYEKYSITQDKESYGLKITISAGDNKLVIKRTAAMN
jgi:hypothetical protein